MDRATAAELYEEARIRRAEGNTTGAFARYRRVLECAQALEDRRWQADLLFELGEMYREACDLLEARRWHQEALAAFRDLNCPREAAETLLRLGMVARLAGDMDAADARFTEALAAGPVDGESPLGHRISGVRGLLRLERSRGKEGAREVVDAWRALRRLAPTEAEGLRAQIAALQPTVGTPRFRGLLREAGTDADEALALGVSL